MYQPQKSWAHRDGTRVHRALRSMILFSAITLIQHGIAAAGPLPLGWTGTNVGGASPVGTAAFDGSTYTIEGAGTDIWDTSDQFMFASQLVTGDVTIVARVDSVERTHYWAKAGVMIRGSLYRKSRHAFMLASAGRGPAFQRRRIYGGTSMHTTGGDASAPEWVKLVRKGSTLTAYCSKDGVTWTKVASDTIDLPATAYVGLAVTSHDNGVLATARFTNVSVVSAATPNQPPTVSLSNPASGATFLAPASIAISASASDSDGTIARVDFYAGTKLLGSDTTSPYAFTWSNVFDGSYTLTAVARDNAGATATSAARKVTVGSSSTSTDTTAPTVSITSPVIGATLTGTVSVSANASDNVGVASVTFKVDGTTIGSADTSAPYGISWNTGSVPAGAHALTAVARDAAGNVTTSSSVSVLIQAATTTNMAPSVSLSAPANGATFIAPASFTISATASDTNGTVARVDFYAGSTLIGMDTSSPYSISWSNVAAGVYTLTAVAQDNDGATTKSAARSVTVNNSTIPTTALFVPSSNDATAVARYVLQIFTAGANAATATPMQTQDLGKPAIVNGECTADIAATIQSLPSGSYIAVIMASGSGGQTQSAPSAPFVR
jgi:hypothetical protein